MFAFGDDLSWVPAGSDLKRPAHQRVADKAWAAFTTVKLEQVHVDDPTFGQALQRLAADSVTADDTTRFSARLLSALSVEQRLSFQSSPRICISGEAAECYNARRR